MNLNVTFHLNSEPSTVASILSQTTVLWHLTGANFLHLPDEDPASFEHFGIAIVEAMFSGCIPIVTFVGGTTDIVSHEYNGFHASTVNDYITYTLNILSSSARRINEMRQYAFKKAQSFGLDRFESNLASLVTTGVKSIALRNVTRNRLEVMRGLPHFEEAKSNKIAVIIEPGLNTLLETVVRNVLFYLGKGWSIRV
jgi:hypothetical protein